jgi:peptide chain release factor
MRFPVGSEKEALLVARLARLNIREEDLLEKFVRSSGPGGQHVNKTSTAVYLKHLPTGIEIKVQSARSQGLNRYQARRLLADAIEARALGERSAAAQRLFKLRKQKRRRSRRAKEKVLAAKHVQADKKRARQQKEHD